MTEWLAGNRIRGTNAERASASVAQATPTKIIDGNYTVLTYTADGKFIPKNAFNVEYLVVAGGGGGGARIGGGGGAGGYLTNLGGTALGVTAQSYPITVGDGGSGGASQQTGVGGQGTNGTNSVFSTITSTGGGGGGRYSTSVANAGSSGGSGGGGGGNSSGSSGGSASPSGQGYAGGSGASGASGAGAGGGAGAVGGAGSSASAGGVGGVGLSNSITGTAIFYAGGGGGSADDLAGTASAGGALGGNGGGGRGGTNGTTDDATNGTNGLGGGAGGSRRDNIAGHTGGSGVVILRFLTSGNTYDIEQVGLQLSLPSVGGWHEIGRTTLDSAGNIIDVTSLPDKRYYMVLYYVKNDDGNAINCNNRFNSDTGTNYRIRSNSSDGGGEYTPTSQTSLGLTDGSGSPHFIVEYIANLSNKEKLTISHVIRQRNSGADNSPSRSEVVGKWVNTSSSISSLSANNAGAGSYASGSEVVVLGWDDSDAHTTNFWEELASVDLSGGASTSLSTGTFTAKKYLWVQIFSKKASAGGIQPSLKVGTGGTIATGSPYAFRWSNDGAADPTPSVDLAMCPIAWLGANVHFSNTFIINNSGNEKLFINHSVANVTAGAGTAPQRVESVGKFANTSGQINIIDLYDWDSASLGTETIMKVWGSD